MRFLLDENVSQTVSRGLESSGFFASHIEEFGLASTPDEDILTIAKKKRLTIITHDKDFGNLIRFPIQDHYGVILLRFRNQKPQNVLPYLLQFLKSPRKLKSRLVILREDGFRIV